MRKLILFSLMAVLLMSCGGAGQLPTDNITFGTAWHHVSKSFGYWIFVIIAIALIAGYVYRTAKSEDGWYGQSYLISFALLLILLFAIFFRPCEVAANTAVEQAARGVFIGY